MQCIRLIFSLSVSSVCGGNLSYAKPESAGNLVCFLSCHSTCLISQKSRSGDTRPLNKPRNSRNYVSEALSWNMGSFSSKMAPQFLHSEWTALRILFFSQFACDSVGINMVGVCFFTKTWLYARCQKFNSLWRKLYELHGDFSKISLLFWLFTFLLYVNY